MSRINPADAPPHVWHRIAEDANRERPKGVEAIEAHQVQDLVEEAHRRKLDGYRLTDEAEGMGAGIITRLARTYGMEV